MFIAGSCLVKRVRPPPDRLYILSDWGKYPFVRSICAGAAATPRGIPSMRRDGSFRVNADGVRASITGRFRLFYDVGMSRQVSWLNSDKGVPETGPSAPKTLVYNA